jgi:fibronectin-binding autotransporter adhesin
MNKAIHLVTSLIAFALVGASAHAASSYWDSNDITPGAGDTPTGTWGTDNFWSTDSTGAATTTAWTSGDIAVFSAGTDATNAFTVTVNGNQTAGGITFEEGVVTLSGGTITIGVASLPIVATTNATIDSVLAGPGTAGMTKSGTGTLTLNGANTYPGATAISAGVVAVGNANAFGSTAAQTTIGSGAQVQIGGGIALADTLTFTSPGNGVGSTGALRSISGSNSVDFINGGTAVGNSSRINIDAGTLFVRQINAANRTTLTFGGDGDFISAPNPATVNLDGLFWGGEPGNVIKEGSGTLTINGQCNIRGTFTVSAGTAKWGASNRFGNGGNVIPDLTVNGTFNLNGFNESVDGLNGAGSVVNAGTSTLSLRVGAGSTSHVASPNFTGVISGGTTLQKENATRNQTLSGTNTYTGNTIINAGTLALGATGSISNSPIINVASNATFDVSAVAGFTLGANQTLMGNGTVAGAVAVAAGGRVSSGASAGKLTFTGGLDLSAGGTNVWELAANSVSDPGTNFDQIVLTGGTLTLGGSSTLSINFIGTATAPVSSDPFWQSVRTWNIISATGAASTFSVIKNGSYPAGNFTTAANGSGIVLTFTPNVAPVAIPPLITSIVGAGTTSVVVNYSNTLAGTNYVVQYRTNFDTTNWNSPTNWTSLSPVPAVGSTSSSTDSPPAGDFGRLYRVYYVTP